MSTTGAAGPELDFSPPDKWSVRQLVCHLADTEAVWVVRFRQVIAEENPALSAFDQNAWAEKLDYKRRKISQALEQFRVLRHENFELLKEVPEADFARIGNHSKRGPLTLFDMVKIAAEHVETHVRQIQSVRGAYKESRKKTEDRSQKSESPSG